MSLEVAGWNVAKGLGNDNVGLVLEGLKTLESSDVIVLSEAYATDATTPTGFEHDVIGRVRDFSDDYGYASLSSTPYEDSDVTRPGAPAGFEQHLIMLCRPLILSSAVVRLGSRNALSAFIDDPDRDREIRVFGAHFDDRTETSRRGMSYSFLDKTKRQVPTVLVGDLNAMHGQDIRARVLRSRATELLASHLPTGRSRWLGGRLVGMAHGSTLDILDRAGFVDADPKHQATFSFAGPHFVQLDHIMAKNVTVDDFRIHDIDGSDHRAISATIRS